MLGYWKTWVRAAPTPKPCQDRKIAAPRDAQSRRVNPGRPLQPYFSLLGSLLLALAAHYTMSETDNPLANWAQKAFYFGMGLAAVAADNAAKVASKAGIRLMELRKQAQALVDELVERGAMTAEEARAYMDAIAANANRKGEYRQTAGPRKITIDDISDTEGEAGTAIELSEAARLRQKIAELQAELDRLKGKSQAKG